jgi:hypothetical protein
MDGDVLGDVHQRFGPAQHQGLAFGGLHGLGEIQGTLNVNTRLLAFKALHQFEHAAVRRAELVFLAFNLIEQALFLR